MSIERFCMLKIICESTEYKDFVHYCFGYTYKHQVLLSRATMLRIFITFGSIKNLKCSKYIF